MDSEVDLSALLLTEARVAGHCFLDNDIMTIFYFITQVDQFIISIQEKYKEYASLDYTKFYVGIASHEERRLKQHRVKHDFQIWDLGNEYISRQTEKYFTRYKNTKGWEGGGYNNPKYLYCYLIKSYTKQ
jgi:hypothetical protein